MSFCCCTKITLPWSLKCDVLAEVMDMAGEMMDMVGEVMDMAGEMRDMIWEMMGMDMVGKGAKGKPNPTWNTRNTWNIWSFKAVL